MSDEKDNAEPSGASGGSARHTLGPWTIYPETDGTEICAVDYTPVLTCRQIIARPVRGDNWIQNAMLIAAAPDLLVALQKIAAIQWGWDGDCGAARIAEDAIAKALGQ